MKFPHVFTSIATLVALSMPVATAQTIISNETLVSTTFVVNKQSATVKCGKTGCGAKTTIFAPIPVTCPGCHRTNMHLPYFSRREDFN